MSKKYKIVISKSAKKDIADKKKYIIQNFKYREYADNYLKKIYRTLKELDTFPAGHEKIGLKYRGYEIYINPQDNQLIFYTVDEKSSAVIVLRIMQDGMDWKNIISLWLGQR